MRLKILLNVFFYLLILFGLPVTGVFLTGKPLAAYLAFPPLTRYVSHADFSWLLFCVLVFITLAIVLFFDLKVLSTIKKNSFKQLRTKNEVLPEKRLPWWAWLSASILTGAWILSWTRFDWFKPYQIFTFTPLWLGYIGLVNGLTEKRSGACMLTQRPFFLLKLFFLSAIFWWFFEYLNRFVQNWYYIGIDELSPLMYFIYATLPFSTVLPAVFSTCELIRTYPDQGAGLHNYIKIDFGHSPLFSGMIFILASFGLLGTGIWPDYLFPCLWVSPMLIITCMQSMQGEKTIFAPLKDGDWKEIYLMAMSALICGFFWEMWNYFSLAKWAYSIPFAGRFKLFEMPVAGYAGYLFFGLECLVVSTLKIKDA